MPKGKDPELAAGASGSAGRSPGLTVVYLARHGQTPLNESGVLRGLADPPLDEALVALDAGFGDPDAVPVTADA
jgi:Histidine phosphatase superfamily (branch 1)